MKQVNVIHIISSLTRGGRERQLATIYKYAVRDSNPIKIICFKQSTASYIDEYGMHADVIFLKSNSFIQRLFEIIRINKSNNCKILWSWGAKEASYAIVISLLLNVKHINGSIRHGIVRFNVHQIWRMLLLHLSRHIVANSKAGLKANKLNRGKVLYNGIDAAFFEEPIDSFNIRNVFGVSNQKILITSVANLVPYKDYETVLRALYEIRKMGFVFYYIAIGEGSERKKLEELTEKLNLTDVVGFVGRRTDIKEILYSSDLFIHSSLGEGCSNAILEAMAAGLPIIATNTGGTPEIVDNYMGRLFDYKNIDQLQSHIVELLNSEPLRKQLANNAKDKAINSFSIEKMMENYNCIMDELLK